MESSSNQTLSSEANGIVSLNGQLQYYPFRPGLCPPQYYVILQGFFAPLIIIISTMLNLSIAAVLLQKHLRSSTNILLLAIAFYDTLTGLSPFPAYLYIYTFRNCNDYAPYFYGYFHRISHDILPFIFHTCSIWVHTIYCILLCNLLSSHLLGNSCISYSTLYIFMSFTKDQTMVYYTDGT